MTLPFDSQIHRALLALGFTIAGAGDVAEIAAGDVTITVIEVRDGKFRLSISLPRGALTLRVRRDQLVVAAGIHAASLRRRERVDVDAG